MSAAFVERIRGAYLRLGCETLGPTLDFFTEELGFELQSIFPADDPATARLVGYGLAIELQRGLEGPVGELLLTCEGELPEERVAPNGTRIRFVSAEPAIEIPPLQATRVLTRMADGASWVEGRAGMLYRDLLPDRLGGRFIASHIRIPAGGPVPDYEHYHRVRFQMIYCYRGWVKVVYEDQGEPFVLEAGDCVLQPPTIRHRVLESSAGLEVIEIGCPAEHETHRDSNSSLPTERYDPERRFGGQRFVRHVAKEAGWSAGTLPGFRSRALGFASATDGLAEAWVAQARQLATEFTVHRGELFFAFVLEGHIELQYEGEEAQALVAGDAVSIPADEPHRWQGASEDLELLVLSLPGEPTMG